MREHKELVKEMVKDPNEAFEYLSASLDEYMRDGDLEAFLITLRTVANARGGITELAKKTGLNRQNLYRTLSKSGNPTLTTLRTILSSLGLNLSIIPDKADRSRQWIKV